MFNNLETIPFIGRTTAKNIRISKKIAESYNESLKFHNMDIESILGYKFEIIKEIKNKKARFCEKEGVMHVYYNKNTQFIIPSIYITEDAQYKYFKMKRPSTLSETLNYSNYSEINKGTFAKEEVDFFNINEVKNLHDAFDINSDTHSIDNSILNEGFRDVIKAATAAFTGKNKSDTEESRGTKNNKNKTLNNKGDINPDVIAKRLISSARKTIHGSKNKSDQAIREQWETWEADLTTELTDYLVSNIPDELKKNADKIKKLKNINLTSEETLAKTNIIETFKEFKENSSQTSRIDDVILAIETYWKSQQGYLLGIKGMSENEYKQSVEACYTYINEKAGAFEDMAEHLKKNKDSFISYIEEAAKKDKAGFKQLKITDAIKNSNNYYLNQLGGATRFIFKVLKINKLFERVFGFLKRSYARIVKDNFAYGKGTLGTTISAMLVKAITVLQSHAGNDTSALEWITTSSVNIANGFSYLARQLLVFPIRIGNWLLKLCGWVINGLSELLNWTSKTLPEVKTELTLDERFARAFDPAQPEINTEAIDSIIDTIINLISGDGLNTFIDNIQTIMPDFMLNNPGIFSIILIVGLVYSIFISFKYMTTTFRENIAIIADAGGTLAKILGDYNIIFSAIRGKNIDLYSNYLEVVLHNKLVQKSEQVNEKMTPRSIESDIEEVKTTFKEYIKLVLTDAENGMDAYVAKGVTISALIASLNKEKDFINKRLGSEEDKLNSIKLNMYAIKLDLLIKDLATLLKELEEKVEGLAEESNDTREKASELLNQAAEKAFEEADQVISTLS